MKKELLKRENLKKMAAGVGLVGCGMFTGTFLKESKDGAKKGEALKNMLNPQNLIVAGAAVGLGVLSALINDNDKKMIDIPLFNDEDENEDFNVEAELTDDKDEF